MDIHNPKTWTNSFAASHHDECIRSLCEINELAIHHIQQGSYRAAIYYLDRIVNGLTIINDNSGGAFMPDLCLFYIIEGNTYILCNNAIPEDRRRELAIKMFSNARDFARTTQTKQNMEATISDLRGGISLSILQKDCNADEIVSFLQKLSLKLTEKKESSVAVKEKHYNQERSADFQEWIETNGFTEEDLQYLVQSLRKRTIFLFFLNILDLGIITHPLFVETWAWYKRVKQRTFYPRPGLLWSLNCLAMYITFIMVVPLIIWLIARRTYLGTGLRGMIKKGLIGEGNQSAVNRLIWKKICKKTRIIRFFICASLTLVITISMPMTMSSTKNTLAVILLGKACGYFILFDCLGIVICSIVNNIRYYRRISR